MTFAKFFLFSNAFFLGLRHGIDWDHIAAILDILSGTGTSNSQLKIGPITMSRYSLVLTFLYAIGHGLIVFILGIAAIRFSASLPSWIDPIMERVVGITLLILGFWVFYSLLLHIQGKQTFQLKSRWMIILNAIEHAIASVQSHLTGQIVPRKSLPRRYEPSMAFTVGAIHGIGAETGTQVLLLVGVSTVNQTAGIVMLALFVFGMIVSNTLVASMGSAGLSSKISIKSVYIALGLLTSIFSLVIGSFFAAGDSNKLPNLMKCSVLGGPIEHFVPGIK